MKFRAFLCSAAVIAHLMAGVTSFPSVAMAGQHKMRSAHFITTALVKKGFKVDDVRRKAQVYFIKVEQDGVVAVLSVDGYSSEIIGLKIVSMPSGRTPKPKGTGGNRFVDLTYEYGYYVEIAVFESYYELTSVELSYSESYTEVSYEESEEVSYTEVEETTESDLDNGDPDDAAGDAEAAANDKEDDGPADDAYDAQDAAAPDDSNAASDETPDAAADSANDDTPDTADAPADDTPDTADDNASDDTPDAADDSSSDDSSNSADDSSSDDSSGDAAEE